MLHLSRKVSSSIKDGDVWSSVMSSVVCDAISKRPGWIACLGQSIVSAMKRHFLKLRVTLELVRSMSTFGTRTICLFGVLEKTTIS